MTLLNSGAYYNRISGTCYNDENNSIIPCDFSKMGLTNYAKEMIDVVTWNLGANPEANSIALSPNEFYNAERGNATGKQCSSGEYCNDSVPRTLTWQGKVGLLYVSDYGYATSNRSCLSKAMHSLETWNNDCSENDWLKEKAGQYTLDPTGNFERSSRVFFISKNGAIGYWRICDNVNIIRPVIFLQTNVGIMYGNGSIDAPYELIS